jgi:enoyl-CoA hydratase/carnithine racemase
LILRSRKIYLAALAGPVIGSAISIALSCDLRIATDDMWFWSPDPQYGGILADGGIELTHVLAGASPAAILHLTNDRVDVQKAYAWGLLYKIVSKDNLTTEVTVAAQRLSRLSPYSLAQSKQLMNKDINLTLPDQLLNPLFGNEAALRFLTPYMRRK